MDPCSRTTWILFITFQELGCNHHTLLLVQISKLFGYPSCANLTVPQVILHYSMYRFTADILCAATLHIVIHWSSLMKTYTLLMYVHDAGGSIVIFICHLPIPMAAC